MTGRLVVLRHVQTGWSLTGQHTGTTDLPLTPFGQAQARSLGADLRGWQPHAVLVSPRERARSTAELVGWTGLQTLEDLAEWDYGSYEGRTSPDIQADRARQGLPLWSLWRDGAPGGETAQAVGNRADRALAAADRQRENGDVLLIAHAHVLRILAARWLGLPASYGSALILDPAGIGLLDSEHDLPVLRRWNTTAADLGLQAGLRRDHAAAAAPPGSLSDAPASAVSAQPPTAEAAP